MPYFKENHCFRIISLRDVAVVMRFYLVDSSILGGAGDRTNFVTEKRTSSLIVHGMLWLSHVSISEFGAGKYFHKSLKKK